jgi:hypothetical protein
MAPYWALRSMVRLRSDAVLAGVFLSIRRSTNLRRLFWYRTETPSLRGKAELGTGLHWVVGQRLEGCRQRACD